MQKIIMSLLVMILVKNIAAQDYPIAPEVWSQPKRVEDIYVKGIDASNPSLTKNLDTMYLYRSGEIYVTTLKEGRWQTPKRLNNNVNAGGAMRNPSISKDGRRIYYAAWGGYGNWDLWYNDWNPNTNDWGLYKNLGPKLNSPYMDWYLYEINKDSLFILNTNVGGPSPILYVFDKKKNDWAIADSFYYHKIACCHVQGISMPKNRKKIYYSDISSLWKDSNKKYSELCVVYWDSVKEYWSEPYFLNINSNAYQPDSVNRPWVWLGGVDAFPWTSENGKILYFHSDRREIIEDSSGAWNTYVSYLLIDENGKPVSVGKDNETIPTGYKLYQNYPNPFNPSTKIKYSIPETTFTSLTLYDIRGSRITELVSEEKHPGEYEVELNANRYNLASGVYIYQLRTSSAVLTNKLTLIK